MGSFNPILDTEEDMLIQHVVADGMGGASACDPAVFAVIVAIIVAIGGAGRDCRYHHGFPAISAFQQSGKDLRLGIFHGPASVSDLLLYLPEYICVDDRHMGAFHPKPVISWLFQTLFVLVGYGALFIVDAVANIGFIFQDAIDH